MNNFDNELNNSKNDFFFYSEVENDIRETKPKSEREEGDPPATKKQRQQGLGDGWESASPDKLKGRDLQHLPASRSPECRNKD